ncbi:glycerophosphodiester phosphodiesterase family protein [Fredinandcohnia sp. 179-A 10B2 NHS]|uniref:glycerophosphodiester phosphodiesterase family protein n=1 Tax=Fredinandcohnia sp. 179-A 10B2 NHS TaxID=3235176 RepID=UPI00399F21F4
MKKFKRTKRVLIAFAVLIIFIFLNNTSFFSKNSDTDNLLLAHRGVAQTFTMEGIEWDTCTAERIYEPEHGFPENTIPSIEAAFEAGADIVEFDIKRTKDNQFAVFHDGTLECRSNGSGEPSEYTMEELKHLDIGYGYTADGGKTYPFRGKGIGQMPSMDEVLSKFPNKNLLIHIKSSNPEDGKLLVEFLMKMPKEQLGFLTVYGDDEPIAVLQEKLPELRVMSIATLKSCLLPYIGIGWTGFVPSACDNTQLHIPEKFAPFFWGFPNKFVDRMEKANTRVILVAGDGGWSEGFDTEQDLERLPEDYRGGIWTNSIEKIAPILEKKG